MKKLLVGVDLGTSSTKSTLFTVDGEKIAEASVDIPIYYPKPGIVEQDDEDFYSSAAHTVRTIISESGVDPEDIAAIAFSSQMAGIGMVDEDYIPTARFDSWLDMRCRPYIDIMEEQAGDLITRITGAPPTCDHGAKMLWWMNEEPKNYERTAKFIVPSAYVAGRLAGLKADEAFVDYTFIHFSGFADNEKICWSKELCETFGLDIEKLPRIVKPWDVIGEVTDQSAKDFGLLPGTIIAAGSGDSSANALGAGIVKPGMLLDLAGTASVLSSCTNQYVSDEKHRALLSMHSIVPGLWNPLAYISGGGIALSWYKENIYNTSRSRQLPDEESLYSEMMELADTVSAGSDGLLFSPHLGGRVCPSSSNMRGAWIGLSWVHSKAHLFRSILESIGFEYCFYLDIIKSLIPDLELLETRVVGGGAKGSQWNQMKANILGVPYQRLAGKEFGTWGTAMVAGKAAGLIDDLVEHSLRFAQPCGKPFYPDEDQNRIYQPLIKKYLDMENMLTAFFDR